MKEIGSIEARKAILESCEHKHGAPKKERKYNVYERHLAFHLVPQLYWNSLLKRVQINPSSRDMTYCISAKTIAAQLRHDLGLKRGDSFVWQELNHWGNGFKVLKHFLDFDGSGLDQAFSRDLENLVNFSIQTGLRGYELLSMFAVKHSFNGYIQVFRGSKRLITSNMQSAFKDYMKQAAKFD